MKFREINVYQCIVNISSQDFGVYFRGKPPVGVGSKAEQHGPAKVSLVALGDDVMEPQSNVGGVEWCQWALVIFIEMCWWLWALRSLLGWLWWRWIVLCLAGMLKIWITAKAREIFCRRHVAPIAHPQCCATSHPV